MTKIAVQAVDSAKLPKTGVGSGGTKEANLPLGKEGFSKILQSAAQSPPLEKEVGRQPEAIPQSISDLVAKELGNFPLGDATEAGLASERPIGTMHLTQVDHVSATDVRQTAPVDAIKVITDLGVPARASPVQELSAEFPVESELSGLQNKVREAPVVPGHQTMAAANMVIRQATSPVNRAEPYRPGPSQSSPASLSQAVLDGQSNLTDADSAEQIQPDAPTTRPQLVALSDAAVEQFSVVKEISPTSSTSAGATPIAPASVPSTAHEQPRLLDVKVISARTEVADPELATGRQEGTQVKSIELQLQPDTLGRINIRLTTNAEGLLVQLEPQRVQTAALLTDDQLALQRILTVAGLGTEQATVRILEPPAEPKDLGSQTSPQEEPAAEGNRDWQLDQRSNQHLGADDFPLRGGDFVDERQGLEAPPARANADRGSIYL